jgi:hypothetical protein
VETPTAPGTGLASVAASGASGLNAPNAAGLFHIASNRFFIAW